MTDTEVTEYAIQVDSVVGGWLCGVDGPPFQASVGADEPSTFGSVEMAQERADILGKEYRRLGQPHMVDQIHIVSRTVTTTRSEWSAVGDAEIDQARTTRTIRRLGILTNQSS